jgi:type IV pilus assembly protein PilM
MSLALSRRVSLAFAPPNYLTMPTAGIDLSTSGVKGVVIKASEHGLVGERFVDIRFATPAFTEGDITDRAAVSAALKDLAHRLGTPVFSISLPESKSYLFEADALGETKEEWRTSVEQHLEEYVPLPPAEAAFDIVPVGLHQGGVRVAGVAYAKRIPEEVAEAARTAGLTVRALESESFAAARALLPPGDPTTVLIIDIGKTTTKLTIVVGRVPRFATTVGIGGHSLTLAVQKYFGVTETEARRVKLLHGIVAGEGNEEYLGAMLSTASAIKDEVSRRVDFWRVHATQTGHEPISRAILVGGNASVRGLAEYLEVALHVPVQTGNVFTNFTPPDIWLPPIDYTQSLVYGTAIGLALRTYG